MGLYRKFVFSAPDFCAQFFSVIFAPHQSCATNFLAPTAGPYPEICSGGRLNLKKFRWCDVAAKARKGEPFKEGLGGFSPQENFEYLKPILRILTHIGGKNRPDLDRGKNRPDRPTICLLRTRYKKIMVLDRPCVHNHSPQLLFVASHLKNSLKSSILFR